MPLSIGLLRNPILNSLYDKMLKEELDFLGFQWSKVPVGAR